MSNKITVTLYHYLDENDKIMSRKELNRRITSLQKDNEKLRECAEFYAEGDNWFREYEHDGNMSPNDSVICDSDLEGYYWYSPLRGGQTRGIGGKFARQTLKEITAENSEVEDDSNN